jgi:nucleolar MIF4G domain-containing protein 1
VKAPLSPSEPLPPERLAAQKSKSALAKLAERSQKPAAPLRSEREKQEDAYISYLESKLGWRKGRDKTKSYGSGLDEDGLDGVLSHTSPLRLGSRADSQCQGCWMVWITSTI